MSRTRHRKPHGKLDLGPSKVAIDAHHRKGGVHQDQRVDHKADRKAAKRELSSWERHGDYDG